MGPTAYSCISSGVTAADGASKQEWPRPPSCTCTGCRHRTNVAVAIASASATAVAPVADGTAGEGGAPGQPVAAVAAGGEAVGTGGGSVLLTERLGMFGTLRQCAAETTRRARAPTHYTPVSLAGALFGKPSRPVTTGPGPFLPGPLPQLLVARTDARGSHRPYPNRAAAGGGRRMDQKSLPVEQDARSGKGKPHTPFVSVYSS